jgi:hypothetical protein
MLKPKILYLILLVVFSIPYVGYGYGLECAKSAKYPNFDHNPTIQKHIKKKIKPYLLPLDHPVKPILDLIFSTSQPMKNEESFHQAGFETLQVTHASFIRLARHPAIPGFLFKVYLDSERRRKDGRPGWEWLLDRCKGAQNIRKLIQKENIQHFVVPEKYLYPLPARPPSVVQNPQPVILMVTDMQLADHFEVVDAWKNKITRQHLDELYLIISQGYASAALVANVPYTKQGKFACIDTEYVKRKIDCKKVLPFLSEDMQAYWKTCKIDIGHKFMN